MASTSSSSNPSQASSCRSWKYDVFLSFRGEDTRKTFVDHLYSALVQRLIRVYKDDEALPRGDSVGPSLFKGINESYIAVVVFSKNYADSSWCLDELAYIMKCRDERGLIVMPIFYDVDPSQVRKQEGNFGEAFAKQEAKNVTKVELWRKALFDASNIAGWEPKHIASGHEAKAIKEIVNKVHDRLFPLNLDVDEDLVGMTPRIQILKSLLEIGSGAVRMVGIWGVGGGGKTTLATSVCMEISLHFDGYYIVDNIREESSRYGLKRLQESLLSTILKTEVKVQSVAQGKRKIKSILYHSNVLILLDDVDNLGQLEALAGSHNWFGTWSRIIITTRDEHLLKTHRVDRVCPIRLLSVEESIRLFYKHAYNETEPLTDYEKLSLRVVSYAAGLPLALKVLGSFLFDKDRNEWRSALAKLKDIPNFKIMNILKISYDGLEAYEKVLFLHIACFFRWESTVDVMGILEACGLHPLIGIRVLRQKVLVTIVDGRFDMHDLIQEMGLYIVRGERSNNPGIHNRFRIYKEFSNMCFGDTTLENDKIDAIQYNCSYHDQSSRFLKIISNMKKRWSPRVSKYCNNGNDDDQLDVKERNYIKRSRKKIKVLKIKDTISGHIDIERLKNRFKYIITFYSNFPRDSIDRFLNSPFFREWGKFLLIKEPWIHHEFPSQLTVLTICNIKLLSIIPDFAGIPCLQKLKLNNCINLEEIHPSLGNLKNLIYVSVYYCKKFRRFPTIVHIEKLKTLKIKCCPLIFELPEIQSNMECLIKLSLRRIWKVEKQFETVFDELTHILGKMNLSSLRELDLISWGLRSNLEELDPSDNSFLRLGLSPSQITLLKIFRLTDCTRLVNLPELPSSIAILEANYCDSVRTIADCYTNCKWLCKVSLVQGVDTIDGGRLPQSLLQGNAIENPSMLLQLEGIEITSRELLE